MVFCCLFLLAELPLDGGYRVVGDRLRRLGQTSEWIGSGGRYRDELEVMMVVAGCLWRAVVHLARVSLMAHVFEIKMDFSGVRRAVSSTIIPLSLF